MEFVHWQNYLASLSMKFLKNSPDTSQEQCVLFEITSKTYTWLTKLLFATLIWN